MKKDELINLIEQRPNMDINTDDFKMSVFKKVTNEIAVDLGVANLRFHRLFAQYNHRPDRPWFSDEVTGYTIIHNEPTIDYSYVVNQIATSANLKERIENILTRELSLTGKTVEEYLRELRVIEHHLLKEYDNGIVRLDNCELEIIKTLIPTLAKHIPPAGFTNVNALVLEDVEHGKLVYKLNKFYYEDKPISGMSELIKWVVSSAEYVYHLLHEVDSEDSKFVLTEINDGVIH